MKKIEQINTVALIGAGVMGKEIAWACARANMGVRLFDVRPNAAVAARDDVLRWLNADGCGDKADIITAHDTLFSALADVDLAFESVPENLNLKISVHQEIEKFLPAHAIQGSNASALPASEIAIGLKNPAQFFCMNFTHPRSGEKLVEYMPGKHTAPEVAKAACGWSERIGMTPIRLKKEIFGYAQNRIWRAIKKEALFLVENGVASVEDIDRGFSLSWGVPEGPFRIMDKVGLDTVLRIEKEYYARSGNSDDKPSAVLSSLVENGFLGVQSGRGFYNYSEEKKR